MDAVVVRRGESAPSVIQKPRPEPGPGEALVRTLRVGVDGTDHEVLTGGHGEFPAGADHLVLGHEAVGVVAEPNGTRFDAGDVVVPTVRRPPASGTNHYFERGLADMAPPDMCVERGIAGAHGFMADYFTSAEEYLVRIPDSLASMGFLVEPISITEKALELAYASRSSFDWDPKSALVLGNGPLGLLTLAMLDDYDRTYCLGRRDRPDPTIDIIEELGGTYVDSRVTPVDEVADEYEPMDLVYEATGHAKHAIEAVAALGPCGVGALLGVPESWTFEVDGGDFHKDMVMNNKALVGSVNSGVGHFEAAADTLAGLPDWLIDDIVTGVFDPVNASRAFADDETTIKTAVQFSTL
ncbi:glucose 1-dehydrogenase [Halorarius litoreus]|uniref:glucose 1-dehydrogenase n=1 Tax=Halorarius litoreus TaxID=2962676 RepID=UPI0020CEDC07|nr:glucose 1-dehydrogenase [Halorarius litoreus]